MEKTITTFPIKVAYRLQQRYNHILKSARFRIHKYIIHSAQFHGDNLNKRTTLSTPHHSKHNEIFPTNTLFKITC